MNATFKTIDEVKAYLNGFDKKGLDGRDLMRAVGQEIMMNMIAVRGASAVISAWLGFSNQGVLSVATGDMKWRDVGTRNNATNNATNNDKTESAPNAPKQTVKRTKGVIPQVTASWAIAQLQGAWCARGNDPDNFDPPAEITPELFRNIPAFKAQRENWLRHVKEKLGGIDSDAAKDFRAWLGVPLTAEQAKQEASAVNTAQKKIRMKELAYNVNRTYSLLSELNLDSTAIQPLVDLVARIGVIDDQGNLIV